MIPKSKPLRSFELVCSPGRKGWTISSTSGRRSAGRPGLVGAVHRDLHRREAGLGGHAGRAQLRDHSADGGPMARWSRSSRAPARSPRRRRGRLPPRFFHRALAAVALDHARRSGSRSRRAAVIGTASAIWLIGVRRGQHGGDDEDDDDGVAALALQRGDAEDADATSSTKGTGSLKAMPKASGAAHHQVEILDDLVPSRSRCRCRHRASSTWKDRKNFQANTKYHTKAAPPMMNITGLKARNGRKALCLFAEARRDEHPDLARHHREGQAEATPEADLDIGEEGLGQRCRRSSTGLAGRQRIGQRLRQEQVDLPEKR